MREMPAIILIFENRRIGANRQPFIQIDLRVNRVQHIDIELSSSDGGSLQQRIGALRHTTSGGA